MDRNLEWSPPRFATLGDDVGLGALRWTEAADPDWARATPCVEENLETLLTFHLASLSGRDLTPRRRGWVMEPGQDLVATDRLGRIHLFELKKGSVTPSDCDQLEHYLLKQLFADRDSFLAEADAQFALQVDPDRTTRAIVAAMAAQRGDLVGLRLAKRWLTAEHALLRPDGRELTTYRYGRLSPAQQRRFAIEVLRERASNRELISEDAGWFDSVTALGAAWSARLLAPPPAPLAIPAQPMVLWLVGRQIGIGAQERIRRWRAAGVDARALKLEVRRRQQGWLISVTAEHAPIRNRLEDVVVEYLSRRPSLARVQFQLYERVNPSATKSRGGRLLETPKVRLDGNDPISLTELATDPIAAN